MATAGHPDFTTGWVARWVAALQRPAPSPGLGLPCKSSPAFQTCSELGRALVLNQEVKTPSHPPPASRGFPSDPEACACASSGPTHPGLVREALAHAARAPFAHARARNLGRALAARSLRPAPRLQAFPASRTPYGKRRGPIPPGAGSRERRGGAAR